MEVAGAEAEHGFPPRRIDALPGCRGPGGSGGCHTKQYGLVHPEFPVGTRNPDQYFPGGEFVALPEGLHFNRLIRQQEHDLFKACKYSVSAGKNFRSHRGIETPRFFQDVPGLYKVNISSQTSQNLFMGGGVQPLFSDSQPPDIIITVKGGDGAASGVHLTGPKIIPK